MKNVVLIAACALFVGCASTISTKLSKTSFEQFGTEKIIYVLEESEQTPPNSVYVGELKIGDSGFSKNCGYNEVMENAMITARKSGANVIKITELKEPGFVSTCYRMKAGMYRNDDESSLSVIKDKLKAKNKSRLPEDADYAVIYFYRPSGQGFLLGYKIKTANDSIIGRLRDNEKFAYKTKKFGNQEFYGELETKESVKLNIEKGQEYFVRCGVSMGVMFGRPVIESVQNQLGIKEYEAMD